MSCQGTGLKEPHVFYCSPEEISSGNMCIGEWTGDPGPSCFNRVPLCERRSCSEQTLSFSIEFLFVRESQVMEDLEIGGEWATQNVV